MNGNDAKGLPHNWETERAVLGGLLLDAGQLREVRAVLEPKAFHRPAHEALYRLILDLGAGGITPDPITVLDEVEKRGVAEQVGGIAYVVALPQACASVENVGAYAVRVADAARERRFLLALRAAEERTQGGAPLEDVLVEVQDALRRLEGDATAAGEARARARVEGLLRQRVGTFLEPALARMRARALDQERPISLPWPSMNAALAGGFWPGLHVLVGNTGTGKSRTCAIDASGSSNQRFAAFRSAEWMAVGEGSGLRWSMAR